jgi:hypothetical protein
MIKRNSFLMRLCQHLYKGRKEMSAIKGETSLNGRADLENGKISDIPSRISKTKEFQNRRDEFRSKINLYEKYRGDIFSLQGVQF